MGRTFSEDPRKLHSLKISSYKSLPYAFPISSLITLSIPPSLSSLPPPSLSSLPPPSLPPSPPSLSSSLPPSLPPSPPLSITPPSIPLTSPPPSLPSLPPSPPSLPLLPPSLSSLPPSLPLLPASPLSLSSLPLPQYPQYSLSNYRAHAVQSVIQSLLAIVERVLHSVYCPLGGIVMLGGLWYCVFQQHSHRVSCM